MFAGKHSNLTKILVDVLNVRFFSGLSNVSFRYSCTCNGSLPCCAIWFGIVIVNYVYAPGYKVVSNTGDDVEGETFLGDGAHYAPTKEPGSGE